MTCLTDFHWPRREMLLCHSINMKGTKANSLLVLWTLTLPGTTGATAGTTAVPMCGHPLAMPWSSLSQVEAASHFSFCSLSIGCLGGSEKRCSEIHEHGSRLTLLRSMKRKGLLTYSTLIFHTFSEVFQRTLQKPMKYFSGCLLRGACTVLAGAREGDRFPGAEFTDDSESPIVDARSWTQDLCKCRKWF